MTRRPASRGGNGKSGRGPGRAAGGGGSRPPRVGRTAGQASCLLTLAMLPALIVFVALRAAAGKWAS